MKPKKSLGQNFLENKEILNKIVKLGNIKDDGSDLFLPNISEFGP